MSNTFEKHFTVEGEEKIPSVKLDKQKAKVTIDSGDSKTPPSKPKQNQGLQVTPPPVITYKNEITFVDSLSHDQSIKPKKLEEYILAFKQGAEKTAKSTLEMCRVTYEANQTLGDLEFRDFCRSIGFKDYSSTIRKFIAIGKVYPRFIDYANQLPASWTNIYLITQIPAAEFENIIKGKVRMSDLTGSRLQKMLERTKDVSDIRGALRYDKKNSGYVYAKLLFTKVPDDTDWRAAEKAINELCARLPIKFLVEQNVRNVLEQRKDKRYEQTKKHYKNIEMRPDLWDLGAEANAAYKTAERVKEADDKTTVTV